MIKIILLFCIISSIISINNMIGNTYAGHRECKFIVWWCDDVDWDDECTHDYLYSSTITTYIMVGKVLVPQITTTNHYHYDCVRTYDNGTQNVYSYDS